MQGFIALHRELLDKPIWKKSTPEQKSILITLLLLANHEETEWEWQGKKFKVQPGQFITSLESIAKKAGVSIKNVRTAIEKFDKYEFLANESTKTGRLITIINWDTYQNDNKKTGKATGKQVAKTRQTGGKQVATNNNEKKNKDKEDNKLSSSQCGQGEKVTNKELIAELVNEYRQLPNIEPKNGDYAFMGALYNEYGYSEVLCSINKLQATLAVQGLEKPLLYLRGILNNRPKPLTNFHKDRDSLKQSQQPTLPNQQKKSSKQEKLDAFIQETLQDDGWGGSDGQDPAT